MTENNENEFIPFADRVGNNLNRRKLTIVSQTPNEMIVDVTREDSNITSEGSKLTASKLNEVFSEIKAELNSQDKGTKVKINGIGQEELNFTSDPQTQITNIVNNTSKISNASGGFSAGNGAECSIDAIQLGAGTNSTSKSLQVYDDNLYHAETHQLGPELLDAIYPVDTIYLSTNSTSPASLFGGSWEQLKDRFLLGTGDNYTNGVIGGESEHLLTIDELPSHTHKFNRGSANYWSGNVINGYSGNASVFPGFVENTSDGRPDNYQEKTGKGKYFVQPTGASHTHNNMPPYLVVYMWKRVS